MGYKMPRAAMRKIPGAEAGLSLIELMIAIVIGSVIMLGAATLFLQSKISYVQDEELARLQEGGRYAIRYLSRELSMAGFYGGVLRGSDVSADGSIVFDSGGSSCYEFMFSTEIKLEHINDAGPSSDFSVIGMPVGSGGLDCLKPSDLQDGADILLVRRVKDTASVKQGIKAKRGDVDITVDPLATYLEIEDFNVSILLKRGVTGAVATDTDLWEYLPQILFLRNWAVVEGDGIPTLCRRGISTTALGMAVTQCLVQGVEDMQLEFGLDTDADYIVDTYVTDPDEAELGTALSVGVYLLMRSPNEVPGYTNDKRFELGSKTVGAANDKYYRRVIQSTTGLRNSDALGLLR